jgi:hypothetical protein
MEAWDGSHPKAASAVGWVDWLEGAVSKVTTCALALSKAAKKIKVSSNSHPHQKNLFG